MTENKAWEALYTPEQSTPESNSSLTGGSKRMGFLTAKAQDTGDKRQENRDGQRDEEKIILEKDICIICSQEKWWRGSHDEEKTVTVKVMTESKRRENVWEVWGLWMKIVIIIPLIVHFRKDN